MLAGEMPEAASLSFGVVDVRDVADLHLRAMTDPAAAGERFLATSEGETSLLGVATMLRQAFPAFADRLPEREADADAAGAAIHRSATAEKARRVLGWTARPAREAIIASAQSLIDLGVLSPT